MITYADKDWVISVIADLISITHTCGTTYNLSFSGWPASFPYKYYCTCRAVLPEKVKTFIVLSGGKIDKKIIVFAYADRNI